jgi:hypothetical protein
VLGCAALVLPLGLCLVSLFVPVLVPRYFAWSAAPFFVFAGAGLGFVSRARFVALATALSAVCLVNLVPYYGYETKPRWDLVAAKVAAIAHPGDVVLVNNYYAYSVLAVFAARAGLDQRQIKLTWLLPVAAKIAPGHDVWAVYGRSGQGAKKRSAEDYRRSLSLAFGGPMAVNAIGRYILLWRFRAPKPPEPATEAGGYCRLEEEHPPP